MLLIAVVGALAYGTYRIYRFLKNVEEDTINEVMRTKKELTKNLDGIFNPGQSQKTEERPRKEAEIIKDVEEDS